MRNTHLSHRHAQTLQQIFQHPTSTELEWIEVEALVKQFGTVLEEADGSLVFTLSGISEVFHRSQGEAVVGAQHVTDIRNLLERAGVGTAGAIAQPENVAAQVGATENERRAHELNREQNQRAEQQLKTQQNEQHERSAFLQGSAQEHQQGNRQS